MIDAAALVAYCDSLLNTAAFVDYAPNGLQVEGERPIRVLVSGVTACAALIDAAVETEADALLVHLSGSPGAPAAAKATWSRRRAWAWMPS